MSEGDRTVQKLTKETWNDLSQKMMTCSREELDELLAGKIPYEQELFIRHMLAIGENPDWHAYEKYLARRIGKVKDEVEVIMPKPTVILRRDGTEVVLGNMPEPEKDSD